MKAPEQTHHTPDRGAQNINYSMLPPDQLPNWLLEKNTPVKVYNYSMHSPGTQPRGVEYVQQRKSAPREVPIRPLTMPSAAVAPSMVKNVPAAPENISDVVAAASEFQDNAPDPIARVSGVAGSNSREKQEKLAAIASPPAPLAVDNTPATNENVRSVTDHHDASREEDPTPVESNPVVNANPANVAENKTETEVDVSENREEPVIYWSASPPPVIPPAPQAAAPMPIAPPRPAQSAGPQEYPSNAARPASQSFAGWILDNSNISMIIVVGIIIFSLVLIILVALGVV